MYFNALACTSSSDPKSTLYTIYNFSVSTGGSKGGARDAPRGPNSFNFMQFWGENGHIIASFRVGTPSSGKSWIRYWYLTVNCFEFSSSMQIYESNDVWGGGGYSPALRYHVRGLSTHPLWDTHPITGIPNPQTYSLPLVLKFSLK